MSQSRFLSAFAACALCPGLGLGMLFVSAAARAELGGTMPTQASAAAAAPRVLLNGALRVRALTDAGGTSINEYASSTGQIVGYTWEGQTMPDLRALLGKYAGSYFAGASNSVADRNLHTSRIARPNVVVESGGPMRGYVGRAWLPAALPPGVSADDLR